MSPRPSFSGTLDFGRAIGLSFAMFFVLVIPAIGQKKGVVEFIYHGNQPKIHEAIKKAKLVLDDKEKKFYSGISLREDFDYTIEAPRDISKWLYEANLKLKIRGYDGGSDTRTLAYVSSAYPNTIFINTAKLSGRKDSSVANTLIHELIHSLDRQIEDAKFGHGGNSSAGKRFSAPYWIGRYAQQILDGPSFVDEDPVVEETEDIDESKVERWYRA